MENDNGNDILKKAVQFGIGFAAGTALSKAISIDEKEYWEHLKASDDIINSILEKQDIKHKNREQ